MHILLLDNAPIKVMPHLPPTGHRWGLDKSQDLIPIPQGIFSAVGGAKARYAGHLALVNPRPIPCICPVGGRWGMTLIGA
jgi:hypothetical protein